MEARHIQEIKWASGGETRVTKCWRRIVSYVKVGTAEENKEPNAYEDLVGYKQFTKCDNFLH